jgi:hypothetical protein
MLDTLAKHTASQRIDPRGDFFLEREFHDGADHPTEVQGGNEMNQVTPGAQLSTPELPDTERRRRLASVYRLLIELGQRSNSPGSEHSPKPEKTGDQTDRNP